MIWLMDFLYLTKRTASDKVLRDKALILLKLQYMMEVKGILLL